MIDTAEMFAALEGESNDTRSLLRVCSLLKIDTMFLHNAGNDAYVSVQHPRLICVLLRGG